jgi:hypothetical protein
MMRTITLAVLFTLSMFRLQAGTSNSFWQLSTDKEVNVPGEQKLFPKSYILAKLNTPAFRQFQFLIPANETGMPVVISLPTPDGGTMDFRIFEAPMMEAPLAAKYPDIKTYTGVSTTNENVTAKFDYTVFGFHAKVFDGSNTYFIDPYTNINSDWYLVYYKNQYAKPINERMACEVGESNELISPRQAVDINGQTVPPMAYKQNGTQKRTYRLALACTIEYSAAVGGATPTKATVLAAMVTSMNRINGLFEREFSMRANLVANNDTLIFIGASDPYSNTNGGTMLGQNQTTCNARIGSANYDFGHVFSTGGGGIASLASVCSNSTKAQGVTGSPNPVGDPFDIDYVAHEMGHQFGGEHTFNSVTGSCNGNRSSQSAYEIGSATTIMGYAGICGSDNVQTNSDDYYHVRSLEQMTGASVTACAANTASTNQLPTLSPISSTYIIPYRTSFELTATGSDPDNNPLTYCWEQWDRGGSGSAWNTATTTAPLLRSFKPTTSATRVFPQWKELIKNTESYLGEVLPTNARLVKFRCTLRDINNGYGAFYTSPDTVRLDVRTTATLYRVTSQATATTWTGDSPQTITWDVAGTDAAPFNVTNVNIYASIDSGRTFPFLVAANVPNNGTATIISPNSNTTGCRIKVKGAGNVFFDLNDGWIRINEKAWPTELNTITDAQWSVYPNPATGDVRVELPYALENARLQVVNSLGAVISEQGIERNATILLGGVARGIYFVKISSANRGQLVKKLILQ